MGVMRQVESNVGRGIGEVREGGAKDFRGLGTKESNR